MIKYEDIIKRISFIEKRKTKGLTDTLVTC